MFCMDRSKYSIYSGGEVELVEMISHVEFLRDVRKSGYAHGAKLIYDADADYGGWWFCCFPYAICTAQ